MEEFQKKPIQERKSESNHIMTKYPEKIPILVFKSKTSRDIPDLDKNKFLVSKDLTAGQFLYILRKRIKLDSTKAIFVFTEKGTLPVTHEPISILYENHKHEDGFLYMYYSSENTFG